MSGMERGMRELPEVSEGPSEATIMGAWCNEGA